MKLKIEYIDKNELKMYGNNAKKHTASQIEQIKQSIQEFGFNDAIAIWKNNEVIEGHGRLMAVLDMPEIEKVPVVRLDALTDEQRKAYTLVHNKLTMNTNFDTKLLNMELEQIDEIDMETYGFDINVDDSGWYGDERERTNDAYNLDIALGADLTNDFWQMPVIENDNFIPDDIIGFNYAKTSKEKTSGIHFYIDDYQFERVWNNPEKYLEILSQYSCILTPDFSLYMDMPMPMKIWNIYRSRAIGSYYQKKGVKVIPTISWAEEETFKFAFLGIPKGSIVSISTIGVKENPDALQIWTEGVDEMIKQIQPSTILVYGGKLDYDYGDIKVKYYENHVTERWKKK